ncbi:MAG TPA: PBP1A family penicillin-binding protein [Candidatus Methylomirabilis sp.]|jgi:penicillin-binding protein 1A|nr:PBP1A family penicillin-binding protein [Candidatus Methylomirabilis sp.]
MTRAVALALSAVIALASPAPAAPPAAAPEREDLPELERLDIFAPGEPTLLLSKDGEPFATLTQEHRVFVPLARIPRVLRDAVIATEDSRFYRHGALDWRAMARAALSNLTAGRLREGGSTITQQLAKTLFLTPERTVTRKLQEIRLAQKIEERYAKEKILELYLNAVYFGHGAYGAEAAARTYFSKSVRALTLPEAALLAGLIRAPALYSPLLDPARAKARRDHVLERMLAEGFLKEPAAKAAAAAPVRVAPLFKGRGTAPHFVDYVRELLEERYGEAFLARGGLRVTTTLDLSLQGQALEAVRAGVAAAAAALAPAAPRRGAKPPAPPGGGPEGPGLEGALVALEPGTGAIRAMVGGTAYGRSQYNRAARARRQPGSAFKPFVYAAAFERGISAADLLADAPVRYPKGLGKRREAWAPENYDRLYRGEVTVRQALEESINVPTVRLLESIGVESVLDVARRLGIRSPLRREYALALGVSEVTLLELTSAYAALANGGSRAAPHGIVRVEGPGGDLLEEYRPAIQPALKEEVAYLLTSVLQGAVERGTGQKAQALGRPAAGKTGTSQDAADLWFVGYTPELAAGVWLGYDAPRSLGPHETAGRLAAPLWADFMQRALASRPPSAFPVPEEVFFLDVDALTGAPVPPGSPGAIHEVFLRGEEAMGPPPGAEVPEEEPEEVEEGEGSAAEGSP